MIEVGKIVLRAAVPPGHLLIDRAESEKNLRVVIDDKSLSVRNENGEGFSITPEQAIELGQLLMKAAEVQPEYSAAAKALSEEWDKMHARFKDMVSGIGLNHEVDITDSRGTFTKAITPMVDWARLLVLRYIAENPDESKCSYMLIEGVAA